MGKNKFAAVDLDLKYEVFVIHIAILSVNSNDKVYSSKNA